MTPIRWGVSPEGQASAERVDVALRSVARHGQFFDLTGAGVDESVDWRPFADLVGDDVPDAVRVAVGELTERLGATGLRPVVSLLQMSAAAQLCSPLLATAAEFDVVPALAAPHLEFGFAVGGGFRARVVAVPGGTSGDPATLTGALGRQLDQGPIAMFTRALARLVGLSPHTTRGNIASALAGAAGQLATVQADPEVSLRAGRLLEALLTTGALRGSGQLASDGTGGIGFRRRNCCLLVRLPGAGVCGDCILAS